MSDAKRIFHNTLLLTLAAFVMRTVSVSFNVYLTNKIGADGIGLFQLIFAVYLTAITFASSGVRLAAMRLTADNRATGRKNDRQIMKYCFVFSLVCSIVTGAVMFAFSGLIGKMWIGDTRSIKSLRMLCYSLPFVSLSAALDGYFTSAGKLVRYTAVQLLEQVFKIGVTVFALKSAVSQGIEASCRAVTFGISAAEVFSLICSYGVYRFTSEKSENKEERKPIVSKLLKIAIPDGTGSQMRSILMTVEHLLIPVGFKKSGSNPGAALSTYGVIHGMSLPVLLYPSALLSSLSGLLVPEISSQHIAGNEKRISYMTARVLHLTLIFSIGTAGIMYFNADSLSNAVYGNSDAGFYMKILSPLIPVMYADMSVDGILKGLDQQVSYMKYNIIDASLCVVLVYFLVPALSVKGYILVIYISESINFFLSFRRLTKVSEVRLELFRDIFIPLLCVAAAGIMKNIVFALCFSTSAVAEIIFSVICYFIFLFIFRSIDKEEIRWMKRMLPVSRH